MTTLLKRLTQQLIDQGKPEQQAYNIAKKKLTERGHLIPNTDYPTQEGVRLGNMTPKQRALERATKKSGRPLEDYIYDEKTNRTKLAPWAPKKRK